MRKFGRTADEVSIILDAMPDAWHRLDRNDKLNICIEIVEKVLLIETPEKIKGGT